MSVYCTISRGNSHEVLRNPCYETLLKNYNANAGYWQNSGYAYIKTEVRNDYINLEKTSFIILRIQILVTEE
jgi:hypothetical protein